MDTICSLLRVVEYTCISVWLSNDCSSKSLHIKHIFLQCILLFFYFFHSILLCLTWYICPSLAWQEESRFSLLVNQVRFQYFNICPYCSQCKFPILVHVHNSVWPYTTYFCQIQKITTSLTLSLLWVTRT